jgi:hypothetical protein
MTSRLGGAVAALTVLATSALGQTPVGNWRGRAQMAPPQVATGMPEPQRTKATQMYEQYKRMVIALSLKGDHTFTWRAFGGPSFVNSHRMTGAWAVSGKTITFTFPKGPHAATQMDLAGTLIKDGSVIDLLSESGTHIYFSRG